MAISKAEYEKAKAAVEKAYSKESIADYTKAYNEARSSWKSSSDAYSSASWLLVKNSTTWGSSSGWSSSSSSGSSNTSAWWDIYGDVSGKRDAWLTAKDYSNFQETTLSPELNKYGASAREMEKAKSGSISQRNDIIAGNLYKQGITEREGIEKYLKSQPWFTEGTSDIEQNNTIDAIKARIGEIQKGEAGWVSGVEWVEWVEWTTPDLVWWKYWASQVESKDGMYWDAQSQSYVPIYGYNDLSKDLQAEIDRMSEADRKRISNEWAKWMQDEVRTTLDYRRMMDQERERQGLKKEAHDIDQAMWEIQTAQSLRNAEESYNNLKQSWQYLGNMGMPGVSKTKIDAIGDAITEAKTQLQEFRKLKELEGDARANNWEQQVLQYSQQMANLQYDLDWKVWKEIQWALSKYTTAELEGKLDTIDGITAFRKELLDELDANISWITTGSLAQMQYINQQYQDIANRMYEYAENKNKVNSDMSAVKGYYVDGNGNPIYNAKGEVIEVPQSAPMDPVFDKETGKLITFSLDENGNITANVQQLWDSWVETAQSRIINALNYGYSVSDILKAYPDLDPKTVQDLAKIIKPSYNQYGLPTTWEGRNYTAVDVDTMDKVLNNFKNKYKKGDKGGQCGAFVNNYLRELWVIPKDYSLFIDPITEKTKNINSDTPQVGGIVIMNSESKPQYWHVWIITNIDGNGNMTILQSNKEGEEEVFISTKNINDGNILGYFDPTKSIEEYNNWASQWVKGEEKKWYSPEKAPLYESYLNGDYTNIGDLIKDEEFQQEAYIYGRKQGSATALDALSIMAKMNAITRGESKGLFGKIWDVYDWNKLYSQLEKTLTLNQLTELKKRSGASLWAMSDSEWKILWDAATNLSRIGTATWMQTKAWEDEMRALTLAAYPDEANRNNWQQVVLNHWDELAGVYGENWGTVEESSVEIWYDPLQNK